MTKIRIIGKKNNPYSKGIFDDGGFLIGNASKAGYGANFGNMLTSFNTGYSHLENPHEGILVGKDNLGTPNLVEEGELIWNGKKKIGGEWTNNPYVFSDRLMPSAFMIKGVGGSSHKRNQDLDKHINKTTKIKRNEGGENGKPGDDEKIKKDNTNPTSELMLENFRAYLDENGVTDKDKQDQMIAYYQQKFNGLENQDQLQLMSAEGGGELSEQEQAIVLLYADLLNQGDTNDAIGHAPVNEQELNESESEDKDLELDEKISDLQSLIDQLRSIIEYEEGGLLEDVQLEDMSLELIPNNDIQLEPLQAAYGGSMNKYRGVQMTDELIDAIKKQIIQDKKISALVQKVILQGMAYNDSVLQNKIRKAVEDANLYILQEKYIKQKDDYNYQLSQAYRKANADYAYNLHSNNSGDLSVDDDLYYAYGGKKRKSNNNGAEYNRLSTAGKALYRTIMNGRGNPDLRDAIQSLMAKLPKSDLNILSGMMYNLGADGMEMQQDPLSSMQLPDVLLLETQEPTQEELGLNSNSDQLIIDLILQILDLILSDPSILLDLNLMQLLQLLILLLAELLSDLGKQLFTLMMQLFLALLLQMQLQGLELPSDGLLEIPLDLTPLEIQELIPQLLLFAVGGTARAAMRRNNLIAGTQNLLRPDRLPDMPLNDEDNIFLYRMNRSNLDPNVNGYVNNDLNNFNSNYRNDYNNGYSVYNKSSYYDDGHGAPIENNNTYFLFPNGRIYANKNENGYTWNGYVKPDLIKADGGRLYPEGGLPLISLLDYLIFQLIQQLVLQGDLQSMQLALQLTLQLSPLGLQMLLQMMQLALQPELGLLNPDLLQGALTLQDELILQLVLQVLLLILLNPLVLQDQNAMQQILQLILLVALLLSEAGRQVLQLMLDLFQLLLQLIMQQGLNPLMQGNPLGAPLLGLQPGSGDPYIDSLNRYTPNAMLQRQMDQLEELLRLQLALMQLLLAQQLLGGGLMSEGGNLYPEGGQPLINPLDLQILLQIQLLMQGLPTQEALQLVLLLAQLLSPEGLLYLMLMVLGLQLQPEQQQEQPEQELSEQEGLQLGDLQLNPLELQVYDILTLAFDQIRENGEEPKEYNKSEKGGKSFADVVKEISKEYEERPNDPISKRTLDSLLSDLADQLESIREMKHKELLDNAFDLMNPLEFLLFKLTLADLIAQATGLQPQLLPLELQPQELQMPEQPLEAPDLTGMNPLDKEMIDLILLLLGIDPNSLSPEEYQQAALLIALAILLQLQGLEQVPQEASDLDVQAEMLLLGMQSEGGKFAEGGKANKFDGESKVMSLIDNAASLVSHLEDDNSKVDWGRHYNLLGFDKDSNQFNLYKLLLALGINIKDNFYFQKGKEDGNDINILLKEISKVLKANKDTKWDSESTLSTSQLLDLLGYIYLNGKLGNIPISSNISNLSEKIGGLKGKLKLGTKGVNHGELYLSDDGKTLMIMGKTGKLGYRVLDNNGNVNVNLLKTKVGMSNLQIDLMTNMVLEDKYTSSDALTLANKYQGRVIIDPKQVAPQEIIDESEKRANDIISNYNKNNQGKVRTFYSSNPELGYKEKVGNQVIYYEKKTKGPDGEEKTEYYKEPGEGRTPVRINEYAGLVNGNEFSVNDKGEITNNYVNTNHVYMLDSDDNKDGIFGGDYNKLTEKLIEAFNDVKINGSKSQYFDVLRLWINNYNGALQKTTDGTDRRLFKDLINAIDKYNSLPENTTKEQKELIDKEIKKLAEELTNGLSKSGLLDGYSGPYSDLARVRFDAGNTNILNIRGKYINKRQNTKPILKSGKAKLYNSIAEALAKNKDLKAEDFGLIRGYYGNGLADLYLGRDMTGTELIYGNNRVDATTDGKSVFGNEFELKTDENGNVVETYDPDSKTFVQNQVHINQIPVIKDGDRIILLTPEDLQSGTYKKTDETIPIDFGDKSESQKGNYIVYEKGSDKKKPGDTKYKLPETWGHIAHAMGLFGGPTYNNKDFRYIAPLRGYYTYNVPTHVTFFDIPNYDLINLRNQIMQSVANTGSMLSNLNNPSSATSTLLLANSRNGFEALGNMYNKAYQTIGEARNLARSLTDKSVQQADAMLADASKNNAAFANEASRDNLNATAAAAKDNATLGFEQNKLAEEDKGNRYTMAMNTASAMQDDLDKRKLWLIMAENKLFGSMASLVGKHSGAYTANGGKIRKQQRGWSFF